MQVPRGTGFLQTEKRSLHEKKTLDSNRGRRFGIESLKCSPAHVPGHQRPGGPLQCIIIRALIMGMGCGGGS